MDINKVLKNIKRQKNKKRCYHPLANGSCEKFISAHSIQKNKELKAIAKNGKVIQIKVEISWNGANHKAKPEGKGIVSTFFGFCETHDNELFKPIDICDLVPNTEQAFLFAYRSICKELFEKENGVQNLTDIIEHIEDLSKRDIAKSLLLGNQIGLDNLMKYKKGFDEIYLNKEFEKIRFYTIRFDSKAVIHFSGLTFPDYDFHSNRLQNILEKPALLTFCSAVMNDGWGMIFSWTVEYDNICIPFMESLEKSIYKGNSLTDLLFNFVLQNCENVAFSPEWWNNLSEIERIKIIDIVQKRNSMFYDVSADKNEKIELNIPDWNFKNTITNIEKRNANTQYSKKQ